MIVWLCEDMKVTRQYIRDLLEPLCLEVRECRTVDSAIASIEEMSHEDVVCLDSTMPLGSQSSDYAGELIAVAIRSAGKGCRFIWYSANEFPLILSQFDSHKVDNCEELPALIDDLRTQAPESVAPDPSHVTLAKQYQKQFDTGYNSLEPLLPLSILIQGYLAIIAATQLGDGDYRTDNPVFDRLKALSKPAMDEYLERVTSQRSAIDCLVSKDLNRSGWFDLGVQAFEPYRTSLLNAQVPDRLETFRIPMDTWPRLRKWLLAETSRSEAAQSLLQKPYDASELGIEIKLYRAAAEAVASLGRELLLLQDPTVSHVGTLSDWYSRIRLAHLAFEILGVVHV